MNPYEFRPWYPRGIRYFIAAGASNYVALFDDLTVLKFPLVSPHEQDVYDAQAQAYRKSFRCASVRGLDVERQILETLGHHPRILRLKQKHEDGLLLEYMPNGSVEKYLRKVAPDTSLDVRLSWALQAAEGLAFVHERNVLHCDVSVGNLLLDSDLNIKLSDFQGKLLDSDGAVLLDGGAAESVMSSMPQPDGNHCDCRTDIFALGTAIFFMITGQPPFPDLDTLDDENEIQRRFEAGEVPSLEHHQGGDVVRKCWKGIYRSADEIVVDLLMLQAARNESCDVQSGESMQVTRLPVA